MIKSAFSQRTSEVYGLTQSQSLIWTGQQLNPESPMYNMAFAFEINGEIDVALFKQAFSILIEKSDAMRSTVTVEKYNPQLNIHSSLGYNLEFLDFSSKTNKEISNWINKRCKQIFDLEKCLFDSVLIRKSEQSYLWVLNQHHLITDGWSKTIQFKALSNIYESLVNGDSKDSIDLPKYSDYIKYEHDKETNEASNTYWKNTCDLIKKEFSAQGLKTRTKTESVRIPCNLHQDVIADLKKLVEEPDLKSWTADISLFTILTSILSILLAKQYNTNKLVIGVPVLNRQTLNHKKTLGLFMELFPMPIEVKADDTFLSLYTRTRTSYFECLKNAGSGRSNADMATTISVLINFMNGSFGDFAGVATTSEWVFVDHVDPGHAIRLQIFDFNESGSFSVSFDMNKAIFNEGQQQNIIDEFNRLLKLFILDKTKRINEQAETEQEILKRLNKADVAYPTDNTLVDVFENQVYIRPNKIAVKDGERSLTFKQLDIRANQLAHHLKKLGVREGEMVVISLDRSLEIIVATLATIKLGCTYVPIDPEYPEERFNYIIKDLQARWAISNPSYKELFSEADINFINIWNKQIDENDLTAPVRSFTSEQSLYVIYTSGSTGKPKGVVINHRNVIRLFFNDTPLYDFNETDVWTLFHSFCFDWSVWEMYGSLLFGGTLVIVPKEVTTDPEAYSNLLVTNGVTILNQTPRVFYNLQGIHLSKNKSTKIRYVIFGGEALSPVRLREWKKQYSECRMINMYGITETTVHVTYKELFMEDMVLGISNIGTSIPTLECYILNENLEVQPFGVVGELYIGGAGLAVKYFNRPKLTEEKFIAHPFRKGKDERLYKSGDIGLRLPNGDIKYLGRKDSQVKIRGHRIELGEIEAAINEHNSVIQSAVIAHTDEQDNVRLIAYTETRSEFNKESIEKHLEKKLPVFMMPQAIINLPSIQLTKNGKIDKSMLPKFDPNSLSSGSDFMPAETEIEEFVSEIWMSVLGMDKISINKDFFRIGGDSLSGIRVMTSINDELELNLPVTLIFETTTISDMAAYVENKIKNLMQTMENKSSNNN